MMVWADLKLYRAGLFFVALVSIVVYGEQPVFCRVPAERLHNVMISNLEKKPNLSEQDIYKLGYHHQKMGDFYSEVARCIARLTMSQVQCYRRSGESRDIEYFYALSGLELGKSDSLVRICNAVGSSGGGSQTLLALLAMLCHISGAGNTIGDGLDWLSVGPQFYPDSLEALYQVINSTGGFPQDHPDVNPGRTKVENLSLRPLLDRARLSLYLADDDIDSIRRFLQVFEEEGIPSWHITRAGSANPITFIDPALFSLIGKAHYRLAEIDFWRVIEKTSDLERLQNAVNRLGDMYFRQQDQNKADDVFNKAEDAPRSYPYRGWIAWQRGDSAGAWEFWKQCLESGEYSIDANLLRIWTSMPQMEAEVPALIESLLADLGGLKNQSDLQRSPTGRRKLQVIFRAIGAWYSTREVYDSASSYYERSDIINQDVTIESYPVDYCAELLASRTFHSTTDLRNAAYAGWQKLGTYFPAARSVAWLFGEVVLCGDHKYLE